MRSAGRDNQPNDMLDRLREPADLHRAHVLPHDDRADAHPPAPDEHACRIDCKVECGPRQQRTMRWFVEPLATAARSMKAGPPPSSENARAVISVSPAPASTSKPVRCTRECDTSLATRRTGELACDAHEVAGKERPL